MKILLCGHSVVDKIHEKDKVITQPGGIFYSASTILQISDSSDQIYLCTRIDVKHRELFNSVYEKLNQSYIEEGKEIPIVELGLSEHCERTEHYKNITSNLNIPLTDLESFDGILINMITGFDINLNQLKSILTSSDALIYFDVHTLSRGIDEKGRRKFRTIPDFDKWAENIDILQSNESEIMTLFDLSNTNEIINRLFEIGVQIVCLTLGEKGVKIYYKNQGEICWFFRSTKSVDSSNQIGLGDVFGATFFYSYIRNRDIFYASERAAQAAEFIASINNLLEFSELQKNVIKRIC